MCTLLIHPAAWLIAFSCWAAFPPLFLCVFWGGVVCVSPSIVLGISPASHSCRHVLVVTTSVHAFLAGLRVLLHWRSIVPEGSKEGTSGRR